MQSQPPSYDSIQPVCNTENSQKTGKRHSRSSLLQVKGSKKYNVKMKSDQRTCNILSVCALDDGTIILSDNGNKKLKCLDPSSLIVRDCDVLEYPNQVCAISNTEVAVGCHYSKLIQFVTVGSAMMKTRCVNLGFKCYGLAYADGKLFISEAKAVFVYNVSGDKLQQFDIDELYLSRLAISRDSTNIYVTCYMKVLIILDRNGSTTGGFNGPELRTSCHIALHSNGDVLICGCDSKNILQFSPDGKLIGEVMKYGKCCHTICCDRNNSRLVVGFDNDDEIEVYDINV